jgi:hypothetical protein
MKQLLINTLNTFGYPVYLQGTLNPDKAYPESFVTFWTDYTADNAHYDDDVHSVDWNFTVIFYSSNPTLVNTVPQMMRTALKNAGFIPQGKGQDIPSDEPTHTGWATEYIYTEIQKKENRHGS